MLAAESWKSATAKAASTWLGMCLRVFPGGGDAELADLQIGVDAAGRHVVLIKQLVQCARVVGTAAANIALRPGGASLAQQLGHGDSWVTGTGRAGGIYASRARAARRRMRV